MSQEPVNLSGPDSEAWQRSLPEGSRFVVANNDPGSFSVWQRVDDDEVGCEFSETGDYRPDLFETDIIDDGWGQSRQARALSEDDYVRLVALYALDPGEAGVQAKCFVATGERV